MDENQVQEVVTTEPAQEPKERKKRNPKVGAMRVSVAGTYVHATRGEVDYATEVIIPRRDDWRAYLQEATLAKLRASDANIQYVITYYVDDEKETETEVSFFGKTPFDLTRDELLAAKCYYGLRAIKCFEDKRAAQTAMYKRLASRLGMEIPAGENNVKQWQEIKLLPLVTPQGDALVKMSFEQRDGAWIKHLAPKDNKGRIEF